LITNIKYIIIRQTKKYLSTMQTETSFLKIQDFENKELIDKCIKDVIGELEENPSIGKMFGKECRQQRSVGFFSDVSKGYKYSKQISLSKKLSESMTELLSCVNEMYSAEYNGILVNKYKSGEDYISAHSDDEVSLDASGVVAISYGEVRTFRIREKITKKIVGNFPLTSYSITQMGGKFQSEYTHEIPKELKKKGERISFTFRKHNE